MLPIGIALFLFFLLSVRNARVSPALQVRSVISPVYEDQRFGEAFLSLTNGSGKDVFFQTGVHNALGTMWFAVERKNGNSWIVETEAAQWKPGDVIVATGVNRLQSGMAVNFQLKLPADGQTRRITMRWNTVPRKVPPFLRRLQHLWWEKRELKPSSYEELHSPEIIVETGSPRIDYEAFSERMSTYAPHTNRVKGEVTFLDRAGLKYSTDSKPVSKR